VLREAVGGGGAGRDPPPGSSKKKQPSPFLHRNGKTGPARGPPRENIVYVDRPVCQPVPVPRPYPTGLPRGLIVFVLLVVLYSCISWFVCLIFLRSKILFGRRSWHLVFSTRMVPHRAPPPARIFVLVDMCKCGIHLPFRNKKLSCESFAPRALFLFHAAW